MDWFFLFFAPILLAGFLLVAVFAFLFPLLGFVITLPFRALGWLLGLFGWLLVLPVLLIGGLLGLAALVVATVLGGVLFLIPFVPFVLLALVVFWLVRRSNRRAAQV